MGYDRRRRAAPTLREDNKKHGAEQRERVYSRQFSVDARESDGSDGSDESDKEYIGGLRPLTFQRELPVIIH